MNHRKGKFHKTSLTVEFGGPKSKAENVFTAQAVHITPYDIDIMGEQQISNEYAVLRDGVLIGLMYPNNIDHKHNLYEYAVYPQRVLKQIFQS